MKCPYPNCRKDYNDTDWPKSISSWINPEEWGHSLNERQTINRIFLISRRCRFCNQLFHEIYVGHENFDKAWNPLASTLYPLGAYPISKTKFEASSVPKKVLDAFNEAERCRSAGSLTGTGTCLRKAVYALCDSKGVSGRDYREKIGNLPVKETDKELLKQIKWLGDNTTKPGEEKYTMEMVDIALEILPVLIDDIYLKDEKADSAAKLLAKARSVNMENLAEHESTEHNS